MIERHGFVRFTALIVAVLVCVGCAARNVVMPAPAPIFRFETDELWLNLHHFLYVLGRAQSRAADAQRNAVVRAPTDAEAGLAGSSESERQAWRDAVSFYANGPSRQDAVFDSSLVRTTAVLGAADDRATLAGVPIDAALMATLEKAAPLYRRAWWPAHRASNERFVREVQTYLDRYGPTVLQFILDKYQLPWPQSGYPIHVSGYTNWAGAYSTAGDLLVVSSLDPGMRGSEGFEIVFHESMHQWDDTVFQLLRGHARRINKLVPRNLSHAMIFFTAGEAVRRVIPGHVPAGEASGVWARGMQPFREPLQRVWKPYLDGTGTRDEALARLVAATAIDRPPSR
jgi:hypothetical protein